MTLRVIAGKAKGRKLKSVPGDMTRPITDRVNEALFNIIAGDMVDSNWWGVFAGTGAVGIEALSRGASFARFSDSNGVPIETIKFNVEHCGFKSQANIRRTRLLFFPRGPTESSNTSTLRRRNTRKCGQERLSLPMKILNGWPRMAGDRARCSERIQVIGA